MTMSNKNNIMTGFSTILVGAVISVSSSILKSIGNANNVVRNHKEGIEQIPKGALEQISVMTNDFASMIGTMGIFCGLFMMAIGIHQIIASFGKEKEQIRNNPKLNSNKQKDKAETVVTSVTIFFNLKDRPKMRY